MPNNKNPIALLIDGDNVSSSHVPRLLNEITKYSNPIIREVFFNKQSIEKWEQPIIDFSLRPAYVPNNTRGKNAADIALVIRAMELLYEREDLAGFSIVSSDSDFTDLARHIVARGKPLLGIGESKTPESFRNACTQFINIEDLSETEVFSQEPTNIFNQDDEVLIANVQSFEKLFVNAYEVAAQDTDGWVQLLKIKEQMTELDSEFQSSDFQNTRLLADRVKKLAEIYTERIVEVDEKSDSKPVVHLIRVLDCDAFKFIEAYEHTPVKERDGWVVLSVIGAELRKYPAYENGFTYHSSRSRKLSKVVAEMLKDYDGLIEMHEEHDDNTVIHLVRVNF